MRCGYFSFFNSNPTSIFFAYYAKNMTTTYKRMTSTFGSDKKDEITNKVTPRVYNALNARLADHTYCKQALVKGITTLDFLYGSGLDRILDSKVPMNKNITYWLFAENLFRAGN